MVNIGNMMKQAQQLQKKMADAQEKLNLINKLCQQILYLINQNKNGIYHLGTYDLIYHDDLINKIITRKLKSKAMFKYVYSSNTARYIATLPKENKLPKHLNISCNEVINSLSIKRSF